MRRMIFLAALASALAFGVLAPGGAFSAVGGSHVPVKGTISGTFTFDLLTWQAQVVGSGQLTHLGRMTMGEEAQYVFTSESTFTASFDTAFTAANGDQVFLTGTSSGAFTDGTHAAHQGVWTSTGGTGRFANASLTATGTVHVTFITQTSGVFTATVNGELDWGR